MRFSLLAWATALFLSSNSLAETGLVYLSNGHTSNNGPLTLTTSDLRLLIAQRLGLSEFHSLDGASDAALEAINRYDTKSHTSRAMFTTKEARSPQALMVIEGIDTHALDASSRSPASSLILNQCPSSSINADFLGDIQHQHASVYGVNNALKPTSEASEPLSTLRHWMKQVSGEAMTEDLILHSTGLQRLADDQGSGSKAYENALRHLADGLESILSDTDSSFEFVIVAMPLRSSGLFKRAIGGSWGTYTKVQRQVRPVPGLGRPFLQDSDIDDEAVPIADAVRPELLENQGFSRIGVESQRPTMAHISPIHEARPTPSETTSVRPLEMELEHEIAAFQSNTTVDPPRGILPACFTSESLCQSVTHNCSGHGSCQSKYSSKDSSSTCWSCSCSAIREDRGDGGFKTTYWAGPACQKKDVSVPFWLLGSTAVGLLSAVAWGVGLLYSMGSEDLPSVIGAGVAGPRAK